MAIDKVTSASITTDAVGPTQLNEASNYSFTGTVTGAGESNLPYFNVKPSSSDNYSDNTTHRLAFGTVVKDTASGFDNSAGNYKYTVQSGQAGQYVLLHGFRINPTNANRISMTMLLNDSSISQLETDGGGGSTYTALQGARLITLAVGDVIHCTFYQNSSVNSTVRTDGTFLAGFKLTATT